MKKLLLILPLLLLTACHHEIEAPTDEPMNITNFEECIGAGNPAMESYPRQCQANGQTFTEVITLPPEVSEELPVNPEGPSVMETSCSNGGGIWLADSNECENASQKWCEKNGGNWNECASACRNQPEAEICTMQCVLVCQF